MKSPGAQFPANRRWHRLAVAAVVAAGLSPSVAKADPRNIHVTYGADPAHSVSASWRTDTALDSPKVRFGPEGSAEVRWSEVSGMNITSIESAGGFNHHAALENLLPATRYNYRVSGPTNSWGPVCAFKTAPQSGGFTFAVVGDIQGKTNASAVWGAAGAWLAARDDVDFAVLLGDLVDTGADQTQWEAFFNPILPPGGASLFESKAIMPILGNHDYYGGTNNSEGVNLFVAQFRLPSNGTADWDGRFYTFPYGDARFVMLDTEGASSITNQTVWMNSLDWTDRPCTFVALHSPVYQFKDGHTSSVPGRDVWRPHFFNEHAQLVFNGHNHTLAASVPLRATRLDGLSGGKGFAGPWQAKEDKGCPTGMPALLLLEEGDQISYPGLADTGRAVSSLTAGTVLSPYPTLDAQRPVQPIVPGEGQDLWIGYLHKKKGAYYTNGRGGWRLADSSSSSRYLEVATSRSGTPTSGHFRIGAGTKTAESPNVIAVQGSVPAEPFFVMAKFTFAGGKVTGRLKTYRAPEALPAGEPSEWEATVELSADWAGSTFNKLVLLGESNDKDSLFDEFRVGRSMADVLPAAEGAQPPAGALVEEGFDVAPTGTDGVVYFDGGGVNFNEPPSDYWYVRYGQDASYMPIVSLFTVQADKTVGRTVLFADYGGNPAGTVLDEFEIPRELTALQTWRQLHFGSASAEGDAADDADPDADGFGNFLEYAVGADPRSRSPAAVQAHMDTDRLKMVFSRIADPSLTYEVQFSGDLVSWTNAWTSSGAGNIAEQITYTDPVGTGDVPRRFMRLRVGTPAP